MEENFLFVNLLVSLKSVSIQFISLLKNQSIYIIWEQPFWILEQNFIGKGEAIKQIVQSPCINSFTRN